jgi:nitrogenase molybdenum-iron protein alpha chain
MLEYNALDSAETYHVYEEFDPPVGLDQSYRDTLYILPPLMFMMLPTIKVDADSRNIEELHVEKDEALYRAYLSERKERLLSEGYKFSDYEGMMPEMDAESLVIDDISSYETEKLIELWKPDVFCAGIKEKFVIQKMGIPCKR